MEMSSTRPPTPKQQLYTKSLVVPAANCGRLAEPALALGMDPGSHLRRSFRMKMDIVSMLQSLAYQIMCTVFVFTHKNSWGLQSHVVTTAVEYLDAAARYAELLHP